MTAAVAALALAIREHALPFVLLLGAMAVWRRDWKEAAAWGALVAVFCGAMALGRLETLAIIALFNPSLWRY